MKKQSFIRENPWAFLVVPLVFALFTAAVLYGVGRSLVAPYEGLLGLFFSEHIEEVEPRDLLEAASAISDDGSPVLPLSSIDYPAEGDRYATISIEGTNMQNPVYYGDSHTILNRGVGTYKDHSGAGIPGEGKTIMMVAHNNTFFSELKNVQLGALVKLETHYGISTYRIIDMQVKDYQDRTAYDFSRTDENLILYTCHPFDALGFTPNRYFIYAEYLSGPKLDPAR
ncbi:MAG: class D sortase [Oscillospiraceae bacterium]|nr:class D sortase [Oscillospiraceae bacterium]